MNVNVKETVREIAGAGFTERGFEQWWNVRWTLLRIDGETKTPQEYMDAGGSIADVLSAADAFAEGYFI